MKRKWFFIFGLGLLALSFLTSCVGFEEDASSGKYTLYLNDSPVTGDSVYFVVGTNVTAKVLDASGNQVLAVFDFGNGSKLSGNQTNNQYQTAGKYKLTATVADEVISANIVISKVLKFTLKINNNAIDNGSTFKTTKGMPLTFKVVNADGKALTTSFDFGNSSKITADSATISYDTGSYELKAVTGKNTITAKIEVAKASSESIILLSSTISGSTINAVFGLKCSLISNVSFSKDTYVSGEIPGQYWKDYKIVPTDTTRIDGVPYFKWSVNAPAGKYRFSWIQLKDGQTQFSYNNCNWANDLGSKYWSTTDGLFVFYSKINNGKAIISPTN